MYFISLFIVYGNFILFFALIFCTGFEWNIFLYGIFMKKCSIFFYSFPTSHCPPPLIRFHHFSFKTWSFPPSCSCRIAFVIGVRYGESKLPLELLLHCTSHISTHSALWENTGGQTVISAKNNWFQGLQPGKTFQRLSKTVTRRWQFPTVQYTVGVGRWVIYTPDTIHCKSH